MIRTNIIATRPTAPIPAQGKFPYAHRNLAEIKDGYTGCKQCGDERRTRPCGFIACPIWSRY